MRIVEIRIILPMRLEQYPLAEDYMVARRTREESDGKGEGIELIVREPYSNEVESGMYAHKIYHYQSRVPKWIRWAVPTSVTDFIEKSWNAFPHGKCEYAIPFFGEKFKLSLESFSAEWSRDVVMDENFNPAHLTPEEMEIREVEYADIIASPPEPKRDDWKLAGFECADANIEWLDTPTRKYDPSRPPEWTETYRGQMMMITKVVRADIAIFGMQGRLEKYVSREIIPGILLESARAIIGWAPEWANMTREQVDDYTDEAFADVIQGINPEGLTKKEIRAQRKREKKERKEKAKQEKKEKKEKAKREKKEKKEQKEKEKREKKEKKAKSHHDE